MINFRYSVLTDSTMKQYSKLYLKLAKQVNTPKKRFYTVGNRSYLYKKSLS